MAFWELSFCLRGLLPRLGVPRISVFGEFLRFFHHRVSHAAREFVIIAKNAPLRPLKMFYFEVVPAIRASGDEGPLVAQDPR
jgi:hypothetical protein